MSFLCLWRPIFCEQLTVLDNTITEEEKYPVKEDAETEKASQVTYHRKRIHDEHITSLFFHNAFVKIQNIYTERSD